MRILYLSYFYPPLGGAAVLRNVKTVKYLSRLGFEIDVVTTGEPEYLFRDESLFAECAERKLIRTASLDPMSLLGKLRPGRGDKASSLYRDTPERLKLLVRRLYPVDNKVGWLPFLIARASQELKRTRYDLIFVSLGPFSSGRAAWQLSRKSGVPYVVDMRDYWTLLSDYDLQGSAFNRWLSRKWEAELYRDAALIVTATEGIGRDITAAFGGGLKKKLITVYNGWDAEDFAELPEEDPDPGFTLAYFGNIYARRSLRALYRAVERLRGENALPEGFRIKLYGNFFREALDEIEASGCKDLVSIVPQLPHREALQAMQRSSALVLALNSSGPYGTLSSKIFEYLRCQKPILALVPAHNEAAALLRRYGQDHICAMESPDSIYHCLKDLLSSAPKAYPFPADLERKAQIERLAERLESSPGCWSPTGKRRIKPIT
jgi:glycosyltransferase involved in cell wall biosynthesis